LAISEPHLTSLVGFKDDEEPNAKAPPA